MHFFEKKSIENNIILSEVANIMGTSKRKLRTFCAEGRIDRNMEIRYNWKIPTKIEVRYKCLLMRGEEYYEDIVF